MSYYTDLNILPTSSMIEIEEAYNKLNNEDLDMEQKLKYNRAYATLYNYNSRRKYDNLMEEVTNNIAGYNIETYSYLETGVDNDNENHDTRFIDNSISKNLDNENNNDLFNYLNNLFSDLNLRLENIEKKLYQKEDTNHSFYKERKKIHTKSVKGKKIVNINTNVNNNGQHKNKIKTISYDEDGNQEITYKILNKHNENDI